MSNCTAACAHSEEECAACLAGGIPKLVADGIEMVRLAHEKGHIGERLKSLIEYHLRAAGKVWAEHFSADPAS